MKKKILPILLKTLAVLFVIAIFASPAVYFYTKYRDADKLLKNPSELSKKEVDSVVGKVSALMQLPTGETPSVATVEDKDKLKDQPFFVNAENGDKVIIYSNAQKAILYRPSINKIIEVTSINLGAKETTIPIALYNGTKITGLTVTLEKQLGKDVTGITIVAKENAAKVDYAKTVVVDLSGTRATEVKQLAEYLGGEVGTLPEGEIKPDSATKAEILIIIGKNYTGTAATATPTPTPSSTPTSTQTQ